MSHLRFFTVGEIKMAKCVHLKIFQNFSHIVFTYLTFIISFFKDYCEKWLVPTYYNLIIVLSKKNRIILSQHTNYYTNTQMIGPLHSWNQPPPLKEASANYALKFWHVIWYVNYLISLSCLPKLWLCKWWNNASWVSYDNFFAYYLSHFNGWLPHLPGKPAL